MIIEAVLFIGLTALGLFILSEFMKKPMLGVIAALILVILAVWVFTSGVQFATGVTTIGGCDTGLWPLFGGPN